MSALSPRDSKMWFWLYSNCLNEWEVKQTDQLGNCKLIWSTVRLRFRNSIFSHKYRTMGTLEKKKRKKNLVTHVTLLTTCDMWHVTHDMWYVTHDIWQVGGVKPSLRISALTVWAWRCFEYLKEKGEWVNQSVTKVFIEQPQLHRVS